MASATMLSRSALSSVSSSSAAARRSGVAAAPALPSRGVFGSNAKKASSSKRSLAVRPVSALATDNKPAVVKVSLSSFFVPSTE